VVRHDASTADADECRRTVSAPPGSWDSRAAPQWDSGPTARIILLNGPSRSGKSTLALQVQDALDVPFLCLSSDQLIERGAVPRRSHDDAFDWVGRMRPRSSMAFIAALARWQRRAMT
jgi:chloramphenicol 3-O-phosphotransferase